MHWHPDKTSAQSNQGTYRFRAPIALQAKQGLNSDSKKLKTDWSFSIPQLLPIIAVNSSRSQTHPAATDVLQT